MVVPQLFVDLALSFYFFLSPGFSTANAERIRRDLLLSWESTVAERMESAPNPYQEGVGSDLPASLRDVQGPWVALVAGSTERRWFELEDSGDWMGVSLHRLVRAGLQVEFAGPAEDPPQFRRMTNMKWDPYDPRYLLTTAGIQLRF